MASDKSKTLGLTWNSPDVKPPPPKKLKPLALLQKLDGLPMRDERRGLKKYRNCFAGIEFQEYLVKNKIVADCSSALDNGTNLISLGLVAPVESTVHHTTLHGDDTLYHLTKQAREMIEGGGVPSRSRSESEAISGNNEEEDDPELTVNISVFCRKKGLLGWVKTGFIYNDEFFEIFSWTDTQTIPWANVQEVRKATAAEESASKKPNLVILMIHGKDRPWQLSFDTPAEASKLIDDFKCNLKRTA
mmetsp:Transcript_32205/g.80800  ORF Transcript_32205/g.80800 Transcript_32205/m.80800 type:complete len:246 (-) Transcript_32205:150-887(-)|eukprot:CAMPEP_0177631300 /NCGR_PEP_ID=MMETSP0447-20121125/1674_1 /TAXON_ID=0 /ORGANISM="Stygamoeba regulata, Strain BSH-02190019" /LENGTH=245 /DNA_ID=CAMNT_0019132771 /DNA_START=157 /DNA_END=894 /DNA_ORIENTATION=-